jgi:glycine cleavage system H protein
MNDVPQELIYTKTHEWLRQDEDGTITVGITMHAQDLLGDVVFVEPPEPDAEVGAGEETAVVESVKAASDIYTPLSGTILEYNESLDDAPSLVNQDPYGDGWLFRLQPSDSHELEQLLDAEQLLTAEQYRESLAEE